MNSINAPDGIYIYIDCQYLNNSLRPGDAYIYGLMQERRNSIANALELHFSCTNSSNYITILHSVNISSGNDLSPICHQAIDRTDVDLLAFRPLGTN